MKTAENYINYTALRLIDGIVGIPCEYGDQDESDDHCRLMTIGAVVTEVRSGLVTMECDRGVYQIEEHEAWKIGDRAEAIVRDGKIVEVRFVK